MKIRNFFKIRFRIFGVLNDIANYFYIIKTVKKIEKTNEWKNLKLRRDWIFRIYTVININLDDERDQNDKESIIEIERFKLLDEIRPIAFYLDSFNFREILKPVTKKIDEEETNAYLLIFKPYFVDLSFKYVFSRILIFSIIIYLFNKFDIVKLISSIINKF